MHDRRSTSTPPAARRSPPQERFPSHAAAPARRPLVLPARALSALALVLLANVASAQGSPVGGVALGPGVLVDVAEARIYLMLPGGGMEAAALGDGAVRWSSDAGARPLRLDAGRLLAQAEATRPGLIPLVVLDADTGERLAERPVTVSDRVMASVDEGLNRRFELEGDGGNRLRWRFRERVARGVPGGEAAFERAGLLSVTSAFAAVAPAPGQPDFHAPVAIEQTLLPALPGRQFLSASGRHVLVSSLDAPAALDDRYRWTLYDRSGNRIGELRADQAYAPFEVVATAGGPVLSHLRPPGVRMLDGRREAYSLQLRVHALSDGRRLWEREVRDTRYSGALPH